ncbi:hypothetical protein ACSQ67_001422 [Phaseolus vulgaris]
MAVLARVRWKKGMGRLIRQLLHPPKRTSKNQSSLGSGGRTLATSNGEGHWRVGEVEVGEEEGDGERSESKSTFPFLDLGKDGTRKVGWVRGAEAIGDRRQKMAAKAVIDVECSLNENVAPKGMGRTHHLEAHLNAQDPNVEARLEGTGEGLKCPIAFEHEGGSKSHVVDGLGSKATEGTLENNRYEEGATSLVNSITGAKPKGSEKAYAQTRSSVRLRLNVGTDGAKSPFPSGVDHGTGWSYEAEVGVAGARQGSWRIVKRDSDKDGVPMEVPGAACFGSARDGLRHHQWAWCPAWLLVWREFSLDATGIVQCRATARVIQLPCIEKKQTTTQSSESIEKIIPRWEQCLGSEEVGSFLFGKRREEEWEDAVERPRLIRPLSILVRIVDRGIELKSYLF